jgi:hypothetical protein
MSTDQPQGFANNWDYLKTELRWLDQVLMLAVSRQRKEGQEVERVSQNRADRVTSHWWKGLVSMEDDIFYDEHRTPGSAKVSYQQQLESRVQLSHRQGVRLALPNLRDRLGLSLFEKNVVLMSLAPEMNRRYARLYRYLQGEDAACKTDLPTVDLVLRLLCRNDAEWRAARTRLTTASPLLRHDLLHISGSADTFLNRPLQLTEPLIVGRAAHRSIVGNIAARIASGDPSNLAGANRGWGGLVGSGGAGATAPGVAVYGAAGGGLHPG